MAALEAEGNVMVAEALQQVINLLLQLSSARFEMLCAVGLLGQVSLFIPTADLTVAGSMVSLGPFLVVIITTPFAALFP